MGGLRKTLVASVNYCRRYPAKLELLKQTLEVVHLYVRNAQKYEADRKTSLKALEAPKEE